MVSVVQTATDRVETPHADLTAAETVWVALALLHERSPHREGFSVEEISVAAVGLGISRAKPVTIRQHAQQHCVANIRRNTNRSRMLSALPSGERRLYWAGDWTHASRTGAATHPSWERLPSRYRYLEAWYTQWAQSSEETQEDDPMLALAGTGKGLFGKHGADAYVDELRSGWDSR